MVSIVVPIYGVEEYVEDCIKSILNQSYRDFEIVLINDGSPDNSVSIVKKILEKQDEIEYQIISTENRGVSAARNTGIENAKGEYIVMIDADDIISPTFLHDFIKMTVEVPDADIYSGAFSVIYGKNKCINSKRNELIVLNRDQAQVCFYERSIKFLLPTLFLRSSFVSDNNIRFDEQVRYSEDVQFIWRCLAYNSKQVVHSSKSNYGYILHPNSTMTSSGINKIMTAYQGFERFYDECGAMLCDSVKKMLKSRTYFSILHGASRMLDYRNFKELYNKANCIALIKQQTKSGKIRHRIAAQCLIISTMLGYKLMRKV